MDLTLTSKHFLFQDRQQQAGLGPSPSHNVFKEDWCLIEENAFRGVVVHTAVGRFNPMALSEMIP